jgi:hypothetical protein
MQKVAGLSIWWGLSPQLAIIVGLYLLHSAWWALALEGIILSLGLIVAVQNGWKPHVGSLARRHLLFIAVHLLAGPALALVWQSRNTEALAALLASVQVTQHTMGLALLLHCTAVPLLEELFWRAALPGKGRCLVRSDLLFALYHTLILILFLPPLLWLLALTILTGAAWTWRREVERSKGLLPALVLHATADLSLLLTVSIMVY